MAAEKSIALIAHDRKKHGFAAFTGVLSQCSIVVPRIHDMPMVVDSAAEILPARQKNTE